MIRAAPPECAWFGGDRYDRYDTSSTCSLVPAILVNVRHGQLRYTVQSALDGLGVRVCTFYFNIMSVKGEESKHQQKNNDDDDDSQAQKAPYFEMNPQETSPSIETTSHQEGGESDSETIPKNNDGGQSDGQDNLKWYAQLPACFKWDWMDYSNSMDELEAAMHGEHTYPVEIYADDILPLWAIDSEYYPWRSFYFGEQNN